MKNKINNLLKQCSFIPYQYQLDALNIISNTNIQKCILQMPCGMGKTFIAIM